MALNAALPSWKKFMFLLGNVRDFSKFGVCPTNKHCPFAWCTYAANVVGKDLDIYAIGTVSFNYIS
jgi:hypothetical protein